MSWELLLFILNLHMRKQDRSGVEMAEPPLTSDPLEAFLCPVPTMVGSVALQVTLS